MVQVMIPAWKDLEKVIKNAKGELIICSPFYSETGLNRVSHSLKGKVKIHFYTRISPSEWANRVSNPEALLKFLVQASSKGHSTELYVNQRLHAKVYIANRKIALVGSSNLSDGGFDQNIEMMVMLEGKVSSGVASLVETRIKPKSRKVDVNKLKRWIKLHKKRVEEVRKASEGLQAKKLSEAQRALDKMLGFGRRKIKITPPKRIDLKKFFIWLKKNRNLAGSEVLIARHENTDRQNLQGHVRQCFFGVLQFLLENPHIQIQLSEDLKLLSKDDVYQPSEDVSDGWLKHIDNHATDAGDGYDYAILRGILPPSVGGTRIGGGGGISTLKRMLPLVSGYLQAKKQGTKN